MERYKAWEETCQIKTTSGKKSLTHNTLRIDFVWHGLRTIVLNWIYTVVQECKSVCVCALSSPTCLDYQLGTLIAGEQSHVDCTALHISTIFVHNGIQLCMAHCGTKRLDSPESIQNHSFNTIMAIHTTIPVNVPIQYIPFKLRHFVFDLWKCISLYREVEKVLQT